MFRVHTPIIRRIRCWAAALVVCPVRMVLIIQNMVATFSVDNWSPIFHPAHTVKFEVDPNYMLFPNIFHSFSFMKPMIPYCFPVSTFLFSHDRLDILYRNKISTCTSRSEEYQNKKDQSYKTSHTQANLLVQICCWYFCHLATWERKTHGLS